MEVLLLACAWLVFEAGSQSEQAKLGMSPAERAHRREHTRHEKAVRKIAEKHGTTPPEGSLDGLSAWKKEPSEDAPAPTLPEAFLSGYRAHPPLARVTTPVGHRMGNWAARGVYWTRDTGRGAMEEFRRRKRERGEPDPAPVYEPLPPDAPPMPTEPPTVGPERAAEGPAPVPGPRPPAEAPEADTAKPEDAAPRTETPPPAGDAAPPEPVTEPHPPSVEGEKDDADTGTGATPDTEGASAPVTEEPKEPAGPAPQPADTAAAADGESEPVTDSGTEEPQTVTAGVTPPVTDAPAPDTGSATAATDEGAAVTGGDTSAPSTEGSGRMATEVTYESVMDESDELSLMCDDDLKVYARIRTRCEREIGRADALHAELESIGAGAGMLAWVTRCRDQYQALYAKLDALEHNTIAQGEAVTRAKALLEVGQGVYADEAQNMEAVLDRDAYISDTVDAEDTTAHTEHYETTGA